MTRNSRGLDSRGTQLANFRGDGVGVGVDQAVRHLPDRHRLERARLKVRPVASADPLRVPEAGFPVRPDCQAVGRHASL